MKKVGLLVAVLLSLFAFTGGAYAQTGNEGNSVNVQMREQNGSGQNGNATLTEENGQLMVMINVSNGTSTPQPAHIHPGTCANLDPVPAVPLQAVVNGTSSTTISGNAKIKGFADLSAGQYAINVHKSAAEVSVYVSCGDILVMQSGAGAGAGTTGGGMNEMGGAGTVGMPRTGYGDYAGLAALIVMSFTMMGFGMKLARRKIRK